MNANFNKIVIIQSLNKFLTGNRLQDDLTILTILTDGIVSSDLINVGNKKEFFACLSEIKKNVQGGKYRPIIHIEAHGNENSLMLASGEFITWQEMKIPFAEINEATRFNLFICISACYGSYLTLALDILDRAPCRALVGPKIAMYPEDLLKDYTGFYEVIFKTKSGSLALQRLNHDLTGNDAKYYLTTADSFFGQVWKKYLRETCSNENLNRRANKMLGKLKKANCTQLPSRNDLKYNIVKCHPQIYEKSKERFFMADLFKENRDIFPVEYERIVQIVHDT